MTQTRLSDYARVTVHDPKPPVTISTRGKTGRGWHFGEAGSVSLSDEEAEKLYEVLKERYGD